MTPQNIQRELEKHGNVVVGGSRAICPEQAKDWDFLVFTKTRVAEVQDGLLKWGFTREAAESSTDYPGDDDDHERWVLPGDPGVDVLLFGPEDEDAFKRWTLATTVGKELKLCDREHRIMLHHAIIYGQWRRPKKPIEDTLDTYDIVPN